jgi:hypothetical protein
MNRPAGRPPPPPRGGRPEQVEAAPVGRVQLQSRADAVLARALRAPPLAAGTIASTRCCFASQCGTVRLPDESVELDDKQELRRGPVLTLASHGKQQRGGRSTVLVVRGTFRGKRQQGSRDEAAPRADRTTLWRMSTTWISWSARLTEASPSIANYSDRLVGDGFTRSRASEARRFITSFVGMDAPQSGSGHASRRVRSRTIATRWAFITSRSTVARGGQWIASPNGRTSATSKSKVVRRSTPIRRGTTPCSSTTRTASSSRS